MLIDSGKGPMADLNADWIKPWQRLLTKESRLEIAQSNDPDRLIVSRLRNLGYDEQDAEEILPIVKGHLS